MPSVNLSEIAMAGVNMRLEAGAVRYASAQKDIPTPLFIIHIYRELHWHKTAEVCKIILHSLRLLFNRIHEVGIRN
jgi:hypothetical protein